MADIRRTGEAVWNGNLREGDGRITSGSGVLKDTAYSFGTRFEDEPGTNPEELIAAAHAACYSMALAHTLDGKGYRPERIETQAVSTLSPQDGGGFRITKMHLETRAQVPDIDETTFQQIAQEAEKGCPVSNALRGGVQIELDAALIRNEERGGPMKAKVDRDLCIGSAVCVSIAPEVFELDDEGLSEVVNPDAGDEELLRDAAENCPMQAIILEDDQGNQIYP